MTSQPQLVLGRQVIDKELLDQKGDRAGKVDDLVLDFPDDGAAPVVVAIVAGPTALARRIGRPAVALARTWYRLVRAPRRDPVEIPWAAVTTLDVTVHVDLVVDRSDLQAVARSVGRTMRHLPGA